MVVGNGSEQNDGDDLVGRVLAEQYRVVDVVSRGANTIICAAVDMEAGLPVTFKIVQPELAESEAFRASFTKQAELAAAIVQPNVASVLDWGDVELGGENTVFWVVEHLGGGSLRDLFDRGRLLEPSQALVVGLEACRALEAAHHRGVTHTELTPAKLVFGADGRLRIVDFGMAELLGRSAWAEPATVPTHVARYASPEQALGRDVGPKTDVYALALCLLEAVTGKVPFDGDSTVSTLAARVDKLMPVSADLGSLASVIERAGRPEADDRFTAVEFGRALVQAAETLPRPEPIPIVATSPFDPAMFAGAGAGAGGAGGAGAGAGVAVAGAAGVGAVVSAVGDGPDSAADLEAGVAGRAPDISAGGRSDSGSGSPDARSDDSAALDEVSAEPESATTQSPPAESAAAESVVADSRPVESVAAESVVADSPPAESAAVESVVADSRPVESVAVESVVETANTQSAPVEPEVIESVGAESAVIESPVVEKADASAAAGVAPAVGTAESGSLAPGGAAEPGSDDPVPVHHGEGLVIIADDSDDADDAATNETGPVIAGAAAVTAGVAATATSAGVPTAATSASPATEQMPVAEMAPIQPATAVYDDERPKRRSGAMAMLALFILAGLAAVAFAAFYLLRTKSYEVPALAGVDEAVALNEIAGNDWIVTIERERSDDEPDAGEVIRSFPLPGAVLEEGADFTLFVSEGPLFRVLPDVTGLTAVEAEAALADLQLQSFVDAEEFDEALAPSIVLAWRVVGAEASVVGDEVLPGTSLALTVSKGPAPRTVPNVVGLPLAEAQAAAAEVQLNAVAGEDAFSDDVPVGIVITQSAAAESELPRDESFTVTLSKGPDLVTLPDLGGLSYTEAQQALTDAGFTIGSLLGTTEGTFESISITAEPVGDQYRRGTSVDLIFL